MEMGTMEESLLQDHSGGVRGVVTIVTGTSKAGAWSKPSVRVCFTWRSGEEIADGGHMIVPSMGQVISSWDVIAFCPAIDRSGRAHITPMA